MTRSASQPASDFAALAARGADRATKSKPTRCHRVNRQRARYAVFPDFHGHGYAIEAAAALIGWARARHNVRRFIASIDPDNEASLAIVRRLGFVQTGEQWDDEDGLELVFELARAANAHERLASRGILGKLLLRA